jgi:hypothetical protein
LIYLSWGMAVAVLSADALAVSRLARSMMTGRADSVVAEGSKGRHCRR